MDIQIYTSSELVDIKNTMLTQLKAAEAGGETCFAYARHTVTRKGKLPSTPVQVLVIGGTNLVTSLVRKSDNRIEILSSKRGKLPVFSSRETFLSYLIEHISDDSDLLAINFAYPMKPVINDGYLDGILLRGTKEHTFDGLVGEPVGEVLSAHVRNQLNRDIRVTVANDTVCLVLSGLLHAVPESLAGGVVGTGFNFAYFSDPTTLVNLESGNFDGFPQTETGMIIDESSSNPGFHLFEKEISGAYLFLHYNLIAERNSLKKISSTKELAGLARGNDDGAELARAIIKRSASLVAVQIGALYELIQSDQAVVLIEGSLFWKGWRYHDLVLHFLEEIGYERNCFAVKRVQDSYIIGASQLLLY